jgi:hypothetical protein
MIRKKEMSGYTGLFIFGVVFILLLNILDRKLLIRKDIKYLSLNLHRALPGDIFVNL